jgi:hypothetical protein
LAAKYILTVLACAFLLAAGLHPACGGSRQHPQSRSWLLIGVIFGVVSAWLWSRT